jgi:hypothetical protein
VYIYLGMLESASTRVINFSDVPAYLRGGQLYQALFANKSHDGGGEGFRVPTGCLKLDPCVKNAEEVRELLTTLRVWVIPDLPVQINDLAFSTGENLEDVAGLTDVLEQFVEQFPQLRSLIAVLSVDARDQQLTKAAELNDVNLMRYLHEEKVRAWTHGECVAAAARGSLEAMTYAHEHGCEWFNPMAMKVRLPRSTGSRKWVRTCACHAAVCNSQLQCYLYALSHECVRYYDCCTGLSATWTPDFLDYIMREEVVYHYVDPPSGTTGETAKTGIIVRYAEAWAQSALDTDSLLILETLLNLGWWAREGYVHRVLKHKSAAMLATLIRHGCELTGCELSYLVHLDRLNEVQPLFDRGQVLTAVNIQAMLKLPNGRRAVEHAVVRRHCSTCDRALIALLGAVDQPVPYDLLELAFSHGFPRAAALCEVAAQEGSLELLQFAHNMGCPLTPNAYKLAAQGGHLSCLQYLVCTGTAPLTAPTPLRRSVRNR